METTIHTIRIPIFNNFPPPFKIFINFFFDDVIRYDGTSYDSSSTYSHGNDSLTSSAGGGTQARALYDYQGEQSTDLSFSAGDTIIITQDDDGSGWTKGQDAHGSEGIFPTSYIEYL